MAYPDGASPDKQSDNDQTTPTELFVLDPATGKIYPLPIPLPVTIPTGTPLLVDLTDRLNFADVASSTETNPAKLVSSPVYAEGSKWKALFDMNAVTYLKWVDKTGILRINLHVQEEISRIELNADDINIAEQWSIKLTLADGTVYKGDKLWFKNGILKLEPPYPAVITIDFQYEGAGANKKAYELIVRVTANNPDHASCLVCEAFDGSGVASQQLNLSYDTLGKPWFVWYTDATGTHVVNEGAGATDYSMVNAHVIQFGAGITVPVASRNIGVKYQFRLPGTTEGMPANISLLTGKQYTVVNNAALADALIHKVGGYYDLQKNAGKKTIVGVSDLDQDVVLKPVVSITGGGEKRDAFANITIAKGSKNAIIGGDDVPIFQVVVAGNVTAYFTKGKTVRISGSTEINGAYVVVQAVFAAGNTTIDLLEAYPGPTPGGVFDGAISAVTTTVETLSDYYPYLEFLYWANVAPTVGNLFVFLLTSMN